MTLLLNAQTNSWTLKWNKNTENDLWRYYIYKDTTTLPTLQIGYTNHTDTTFVDTQIDKGILYFYRVTAVDISLNESDFSEQASAAIPEIKNLPGFYLLPPDCTITYHLDNYVKDPDHQLAELNWEITGANLLTVNLNHNTHELKIITPSNWQNQESLLLKVTDPDSFFDQKNLIISSDSVSSEPSFVNLESITILNISDNNSIQISWETYKATIDYIM